MPPLMQSEAHVSAIFPGAKMRRVSKLVGDVYLHPREREIGHPCAFLKMRYRCDGAAASQATGLPGRRPPRLFWRFTIHPLQLARLTARLLGLFANWRAYPGGQCFQIRIGIGFED